MTRYEGKELIKKLCSLFGPSGCETAVTDFIRTQVDDICDSVTIDRLGNLIARISCKKESAKTMMISAHTDEVGFMVNEITDDGYLKFDTLGGIDEKVLCGKRVLVGDETKQLRGVITSVAIHHKPKDERLNTTKIKSMYIDVGFTKKEEALEHLDIGAYGTFDSEFYSFGENDNKIKGKAIDDRLGCAVMIEAMREIYPIRDKLPCDICFAFTVREEIGISGAKVAAQTIAPDFAIVLETTAVADIAATKDSAKVAIQGEGGAISLMDRSTIYDRELIDMALNTARDNGIAVQIKKYVSGGNDASHIHKSGVGVRTLALSAPTRYLHSPACVADMRDYGAMLSLICAMAKNDFFAK